MSSFWNYRVGILVVSLIFIATVAASTLSVVWRTPRSMSGEDNVITVATSFYPLAEIVGQVGGDHVVVRNMLPFGGEAHDFEPTPRDLVELSEVDLFLYNGAHFEPWVEKWAKGSFVRPRFTVNMIDELSRRGVSFIEKAGGIDPHVWVDPSIYMREIEIVRDALADIDPANSGVYIANAQKYFEKISVLDGAYQKSLASCELKSIITAHDAFGYLARRYGFTAIPIAGVSPDEEPSPRTLAELVRQAGESGAKVVFFEATVSPKLAEVIAREIHAETLVLNPVESFSAEDIRMGEDYDSKMRMNLNNIKKARICH